MESDLSSLFKKMWFILYVCLTDYHFHWGVAVFFLVLLIEEHLGFFPTETHFCNLCLQFWKWYFSDIFFFQYSLAIWVTVYKHLYRTRYDLKSKWSHFDESNHKINLTRSKPFLNENFACLGITEALDTPPHFGAKS